MTAADQQTAAAVRKEPFRPGNVLSPHWMLLVVCVVFAGLRLPVACRQIPSQDEDYFAVPGFTILSDGVPRIPYLPSRNPQGAFYKADELLFTLPPLYFYWQALVYWLIGPSTAAARVASMFCGIAAIVCVHRLAWHWFRNEAAALWSAGLYAASRAIYFPVVVARPDMLCGALGLGALLAIAHWTQSRRRCWLGAAGVAIGAAALTHPFAIVPGMQAAGWILIASRGFQDRLRNLGILVAAATPVFLLWLPLIAMHPEAFRTQFFNAVLDPSGPGLISRLLLPFDSIRAQVPIFLEHVGVLQAALMFGGTAAATGLCFRRPHSGWLTAVVLAWSGIYSHMASVGAHPTKGYWCYTGALLFLCTGGAIARLSAAGTDATDNQRPAARLRFRAVVALTVAIVIMAPGSGVRTVLAHLRHWNDMNYDAPQFTRALIEAVPAQAKLVVDNAYVFDFYRAGRNVTLALDYEFFFSVRGIDYDLVVAGPTSIRDGVPHTLHAVFLRAYGDKTDPFACYAEIYTAPPGDQPADPKDE